MTTARRRLLAAALTISAAFAVSCDGKTRSLGKDDFESICGPTEDFQDVERYDGTLGPSIAFVRAHERPVGQLVWRADIASRWPDPGNVAGERFCTGTLVAPDVFLSAAHCFEGEGSSWDYPRDAQGRVISPEQVATEYEVHFNYQVDPQGNARTEAVFLVEEMIEYRVGDFDYALVKVQGRPGDTWGWTRIATPALAVGDELTIIQHPAARPKKVEAGHFSGYDDDGSMTYNDLDTLGGSSGSGILGAGGAVVGVHPWGGCTATGGANRGIGMAEIAEVSPAIQVLARASCATDDDCDEGCMVGTCDSDHRCSVARRCQPDADACTTDGCDPVGLTCTATPVTCNDGNECTADRCESATGCAAAPVDPCTACNGGAGACLEGICIAGAAIGGTFEQGLSSVWTRRSEVPWATDAAMPHAGAAALASGDIDDEQVSTVVVGARLTAAGEVSFWHRESTEEDYDFLIFSIDGMERGRWSGAAAWTQATFPLAAGSHELTFTYLKDGSVSEGDDRVWIDDVVVGPMAPACQASCRATDTTCDGFDDDCDGTADDDVAATPTTCGVGACAATGELRCQGGAMVDTCVAGTGAPDTNCNGVDDDCDGAADDDYAPTPLPTCGPASCPSQGETVCMNGALVEQCAPRTCEPTQPPTEPEEGGCGGCASGGGGSSTAVLLLLAGIGLLRPRRRS